MDGLDESQIYSLDKGLKHYLEIDGANKSRLIQLVLNCDVKSGELAVCKGDIYLYYIPQSTERQSLTITK